LLYPQNFFLSPSIKTLQIHHPVPDTILIEERHVLSSYIRVFSDTLELKRDEDFLFSPSINHLAESGVESGKASILIFQPENYSSLSIEYAVFPERLFQTFRVYEPFEMTDTLRVIPTRNNWETILFDNHSLNITGNKTISVSTSNQNMLDLNQSLFLRIDGELSSNVFIQAQLNDSQSPITPAGDSRELSSLDEVYFKVYGREYEIAFGDLDMNINGTQFINFNPQFEGLRLSYFDRHNISGAIAISSSRTAYVNFLGIEGNQGPYFLRPDDSTHNVSILPGSETIWLNGVPLFRGNDYRIDYSEGSIEFTLQHFISENSRIQASFQYTDEYYRKNSMLGKGEYNIGQRFRLRAAVILQIDDKDRPLAESLSEADIQMLKEAGNNRPFISGEVFIGEGLGFYRRINMEEKVIYIYALGEPDADYNVHFTYVGSGQGEYNQITPSRFDFVGENQGSFLPIREIIAPARRANYDFSLSYNHDYISFYAETLISEFDKNTFSELDNEDNFSYIHHIQATINPEWENFQPVLNTWYRYRHQNLFTFANIRNPNEAFQFNAFAQPDSLGSSEYYINLRTLTFNLFRQETSYKYLDFQNEIRQSYLMLNQSITQTRFLPALSYRFNFAENDEINISNIIIHEPAIDYKYNIVSLKGNARFFENTDKGKTNSKLISGNRLNQYNTQIAIDNILNSGVAVSYSKEENFWIEPALTDDEAINDWEQLRQSETWTIQTYTRINRQFFTALYSHRIVETYSPEIHEQKFDIAELRTANNLFKNAIQLNGSYILKNTEFFPRARELQYIGQGAGMYDSTGVWTENGDWDWIVVIVGDPSRSVEVQANLNAYTYPANFVSRDSEIFDLFNKINLETNISVMEQTENPQRIRVYFLLPDAIMNDLSHYSQQEWRQTIWYNIQRNRWISRYTYRNNKTQDRRFQALQAYSVTEHEVSLRLLRVYNSDFETIFRLSNQTDSRYDMETDTIASELNIRTSFGNNLIFTTGLGYEQENVLSHFNTQIIDRYKFSEDIMYFLGQRYRFNGNISIRYNVIDDPISSYLPFDKQQGMNLRWLVGANYRMNRIATMNLDYSGYKHPNQMAFHQVRMEVRAEF